MTDTHYLDWERIRTMDAPYPPALMPCISQFFLEENKRESGLDLYDDVFNTDLFFPLQRQRELKYMIQTARTVKPVTVMEIGADEGGSLYHWCKCFPLVKNVIACEIRGLPYRHLFERHFPEIRFLWLEESSCTQQAFDKVHGWLDGSFIDSLFIDGDKLSFHVDFHLYEKVMSPKGVVFMHDMKDKDPRASYDQVIKYGKYKTELYINVTDSEEASDRESRGIECASPHEGWLRHWRGASAGVGTIWMKE